MTKIWDGRSSSLENEQALGVTEYAKRMAERDDYTLLAAYKAELADSSPPQDGLWYRAGEDGYRLCTLVRLVECRIANSPVTKAAPAMLAALKLIHNAMPVADCDDPADWLGEEAHIAFNAIIAAIAAAQGED